MRFKALDGIRGCCALIVAIYHSKFLGHYALWSFTRNSYLFVDFFFVLSGFVIFHSYQQKIHDSATLKSFVIKRFLRLWPLHFFVLLAFIGLEAFKLLINIWVPSEAAPFGVPNSLITIITNILLLQSVGLHDYNSWNVPSWSISAEFLVYLVFAAATLLFDKLRLFIFATLSAISLGILLSSSHENMNISLDFGFVRAIYGFFLGCLIYVIVTKTRQHIKLTTAFFSALEIALCLTVVLYVAQWGDRYLSFFSPAIFGLTIYIFSFEAGIVSRWLSANVFQFLGKISYSIYMTHFIIMTAIGLLIKFVNKLFGGNLFEIVMVQTTEGAMDFYMLSNAWVMDLLTIPYVLCVIGISMLTYRFIEAPAMKLILRK